MTSQKPLRIAIQLYGHLRSFEKTHASLIQNLVAPTARFGIQFDIFIHTWDEMDARQTMPTQFNKDWKYAGLGVSEEVRRDVIAAYQPKALRIEPQIDLTETQLKRVEENGYNLNFCQSFRNVAHSFCSVNQARREHESANDFRYDLVITTRPDIVFYRPLDLGHFFSQARGWQYFVDDDLQSFVFSTYINGVHSVIHPQHYVAGLDLLFLAVPAVCDKLAEWESHFDEMMTTWPEYALVEMMNRHGLKHTYFIYEKDKSWTILRLGAKPESFINRLVNKLYIRLLPILTRSKLFCQHAYLNVTTMRNLTEFHEYVQSHLDLSGQSLATRLLARLRRRT